LEEHGIRIPKIHSVVKLYSVIEKNIKISLAVREDELDIVDLVYIDTRYPSGFGLLPSGFPTDKEAGELLKIAEKVYAEIISKL